MMAPASHHGCMMGIERFDLFSCGLQPWYAQKVGGCTLVGISSDYFTAGNYFAVAKDAKITHTKGKDCL